MRLAILLTVAAMAAVGLAGPVSAFSRIWMQDAQIRAELTNVQLAGIYPNKVAWTEYIHADGRSDYSEGGQTRPGRWTVANDLFCFVYAEPQQGGCFRIVKHSPNCYELYTATIGGHPPAHPPPTARMSWNGRMWREAQPPTCEEKAIS